LYCRRPISTPDGRLLELTEREGFSLLLRVWITATYRLLASLNSQYARRYLRFVSHLREEYRIRSAETPSAADYWLLSQIDQMSLPDERHDKSHYRDHALVTSYDALREAFRDEFRHRPLADSARAKLADLASHALGKKITPDDLPVPGSLTVSDYCFELLETNATRLSRARGRLRDYDRRLRRTIQRELAATARPSK
jgi:hypothetical protein